VTGGTPNIQAIQKCIGNPIDNARIGNRRIVGVIGENPSVYSKSPALWNAAFATLGFEAVYVPLDISASRLPELILALRDSERLLGFNVTVPHKVRVTEYLDELDRGAVRVQAVNTVTRTPDGRLIGHNTDGTGFIESILKPQPGQSKSFIESLASLNVLLIGAGGSARAIAFHVADQLTSGRLLICNRTWIQAASLADEIRGAGNQAQAITEEELPHWVLQAGLIINSTTKGQGGTRALAGGDVMSLDAYSALAAAHPVAVPQSEYGKTDSQNDRVKALQADITRNNQSSLALAHSIPKDVAFYDLIYFPEETVFLRHARITGHKTMNGKPMIICQAARGLFDHICKAELESRGLNTHETYDQITETMYRAW
jgi:shikimate dehydrogenase